jgi:hypothetical protein
LGTVPADEPGVGDRVVGARKGRVLIVPAGQEAGRAVDARHLKHLVVGHIGEDRREPAGQHSLPRSRRADEQDVVGAGSRDLEGPFRVLLALDVLEVHGIDGRGDELALVETAGRDLARLAQEPDDPDEVLEGVDLEVADERGLPGVGPRDDDAAEAAPPGHQRDRQGAAHRLEAPVEGQLAGEEIVAEPLRRDDFEEGQEAEGDGQVEGRALLPPVGRGQVDGDALRFHVVAAVLEGGPDPLLALADSGVGQADSDKGREAGADVDLDLDGIGFDPVEGGARDLDQHGAR